MEMKVECKIADLDGFKTLIELLDKHSEVLPDEVLDCISGIVDGDTFEFGADDLASIGCVTATCFADVEKIDKCVSVNKYLKRVTVFDGHLFPKSMRLVCDDSGKTILEW